MNAGMTCRELYLWARAAFREAGIDDPGRDAVLLTEHFLGLDRQGLALHGDEQPEPAAQKRYCAAVKERAGRRPLQYILGEWELMGMRLFVGEGVLTPREDTVVLVETAARALPEGRAPLGLDLCAGTGAVALGVASLAPHSQITCVELSPLAFSYLEKNLAAYPQYRVKAERGDVLSPGTAARFAESGFDFLTANPPYIKTEELSGLQPEVQKEPALALDGGEDGLTFYRAICGLWTPKLRPGGVLAVEIGEEQGENVSALFRACGIGNVRVEKDWAGKDRCVWGRKRS